MNVVKTLAAKVADKSAALVGTGIGVGGYFVAESGFAQAVASGLVDWDDAADTMKAEMSPALQAAIGLGMIIAGIVLAWALLKRFSRG